MLSKQARTLIANVSEGRAIHSSALRSSHSVSEESQKVSLHGKYRTLLRGKQLRQQGNYALPPWLLRGLHDERAKASDIGSEVGDA